MSEKLNKRPSFYEGILIAFLASIAGAVSYSVALLFLGDGLLRIIIAVLSLSYVLYLILRSQRITGRVTAVGAWLTIAFVAWILPIPFILYVFIHVIMVWTIRTLFYYSSVFAAIQDLILNAAAVVIATWIFVSTSSLWLTLWGFFLIQACSTFIPNVIKKQRINNKSESQSNQFEHAFHRAQNALKKITL